MRNYVRLAAEINTLHIMENIMRFKNKTPNAAFFHTFLYNFKITRKEVLESSLVYYRNLFQNHLKSYVELKRRKFDLMTCNSSL